MTEQIQYDVFLSYNSQDKSAVERMAQSLQNRGLEPFLDRWYLRPGLPWPQKLEEVLHTCKAVAIFLGPYGLGGWQAREIYLALERQKQESLFPVIPVLLPNADPALSFLTLNTWVDLRGGIDDLVALEILAKAIRGEPPGPELQERIDVTLATVCPYRGLQAFREEDAPFFFGRGAFADQLTRTVKQRSLVAVVGASGSGKSSVVFAGLVPRLRRVRPPEVVWDVVSFTPSDRPFHQLAVALVSLLEPEVSPFERRKDANRWAEGIQKGEVSLRDLVEEALVRQPGTDQLLLVADQFEELYTLTPDESVRRGFVDHLLEATAHFPIQVVLTLRGDFYGRVLSHRPFADALQDGVVNLGPMIRGELERTVGEPARKVGLEFERGLVERILEDVGDEPGNLPLLEFALTQLWNRRRGGMLTHQAYEDIERVQGAIAQRAEAEYERLGDEEKRRARRVFLRLVVPGEGTEDTRRRAWKNELLPTGEQAEATEAVIQILADARLVTTARDIATGEEQVDVSHEALIRGWPRLREWIEEDRAGLRTHRRLTEAAAEWEHLGQDKNALYRGARVAEAEEWLRVHPDDPNPLEREFLDASLALRRGEQRRQRLLMAGALVAALIFGLLAFVTFQQRNAAKRQSRIALSRQLAAQALNHLDDQFDLALLLSLEASRLSDVVEVRGSLLDGLEYNPRLTTFLRGHTDWVRSVAFSPDGKTLASSSEDGTIILWDVATGQPIGQPLTGHTDWVRSVAFSPDGQTLASSSCGELDMDTGLCSQFEIRLWDVDTRRPLGQPLIGHADGVSSLALSPDSKTLVSSTEDGTIILWDVATGQPIGQPLTGHTDELSSVGFSLDSQTLASSSDDGTIILWDVATGQPIGQPLAGHTDRVWSVAVSPDGKTLAAAHDNGAIVLWDGAARQPLGQPLIGHTVAVRSMHFSPDGQTLASGGADGTIVLWDVVARQPLSQPLTGHASLVSKVAFSPDGKTLASSSRDNTIILWNIAAHQQLGQSLTAHTDRVWSVAFSPDGKTLASGSDDNTIILWDVVARQPAGQPLTGHTNAVVSVTFSPDGKTLASASYGTIILWDVATCQPLGQPLIAHTDWVLGIALSPDGRLLASASQDNTIILWDLVAHQPVGQPLTGHTDRVWSVAFSPDGKTLASGSYDGTLIIWDIVTRQPIGPPLTGHNDKVLSVAFSPDGQTLVSGGADGTIILWDVVTRQSLGQPLTGHADWVLSVAFNPDGKMLASGSADGTIILWDMYTRQPLGQPLTGHTNRVWSVAFSPDGKMLASSSEDNNIILWDVSFDAWQDYACRIANRNLTRSEWNQFIGLDIPYERTCPDLPPGEGAPSDAPAATY